MAQSPLRDGPMVALVLVLAAAFFWPSIARCDPPIVIVLSFDGVRHDYLDRAHFPALKRMQEQGIRAERLVPVFPSNTFPNHVALATGTHADRHGIMNNVFRDSERGLYDYSKDADWLDAEPIWCAAERQGVIAATFFWVGSETDWRGRGATHRKTPFDSDIGEAEKVDQILAWIDLPESQRPGLIMSWWHGTDGVGHMKGPDHPDIVEQLADQDAHLARLLDGIDDRKIWDHTTVMVVSDHGMTEVTEVIEVRDVLSRAGVEASVIPATATATVFLKDPATKPEALRILRAIPEVVVYAAEDLPAGLRIRHPTRNGDLMLITTPPRTFFQVNLLQSVGLYLGRTMLGWRPGMHGYATDHPDMGAILLSIGRGVPKGVRIGPVQSIQVAPTIAKLLGIAPPAQAEGVSIPEITP